ncbi:UDP-N-acetyl-D-mannosamine dehydrogenase [Halobacteriovorax sp. JY17]|uniref:UDP-N-acetyl-D-mannosamine dehydrogenase n=1 Tax=Halobacteriovorax sp. JY17 TaxID=2014617 RepID=UPI000C514268|nr:UDP-N-acetyl-D-mannosamine dehydrogenase [Halobacteriovorax sp. JY17]PIK14671.1 MAG: UDP-N-acetyl-D-mannosamine dehydrogenase [Halobacteriovorax sp. JY17]
MKSEFKKVAVVGLGYIGLPTAAVVASRGMQVIGIDNNKKVVDTINKGEIHIVEPGLDIVVQASVSAGNLVASEVPAHADVYLIAVPTPFKEGNEPDVSYVKSAVMAIAPVLKKNDLIILESTSPVGTTDKMREWLSEARKDLFFASEGVESCDIYLAYCPERVLPGHVLRELIENDRVIGGINKKSGEVAKRFYKTFVEGDCILTNSRTAEMTKLTENSFRDVNIAFANELSLLCDQFDINVWELIKLANRHPRVDILQPGPGVGGHCISVDPWFLVHQSPKYARIIKTAREVNDYKPEYVVDKVAAAASKFKEPTVAFFGLAFKANIDDLRESPAMEIVESFARKGFGKLMVVEPNVDYLPSQLTDLRIVKAGIDEALKESDILVLLVDHSEFRDMNRDTFVSKIVIDTRGIWK